MGLAHGQEHAQSLVKWYTIEEAEKLAKENPKKLFIDVYTDWCGWCKVMDKKTFSDPNIANYLNTFFYPVKFNAETTDTITFRDSTFINNGIGKRPTHQLGIELLQGKMSYPSTVYLSENLEPLSIVPGYMSPEKIQPILVYFNENVNQLLPFDKFEEYFNKTFVDTSAEETIIKWYDIEEAVKLNNETPKKMLINLYTDNCITCRMMQKTSYNHPVIAKYINEHFYPVNFNALSKDSMVFAETTFKNNQNQHPFHDLAVQLLQGKMNFPSAIYLEDEKQLISAVPGYFPPEGMEMLTSYFGSDAYKTTKWEDYRSSFESEISK
jgi:thioredoxin-related protein